MLFRRRQPRPLVARARGLIWPQSGWRRALRYLALRLIRLPGRPYRIAAGLACGAAVSFTPFIGFHFILAAVTAWLMRASIVAGLLGTAIGNPWTFPLIWMWIYALGARVTGIGLSDGTPGIQAGEIFAQPLDLLLPMAVGGAMMSPLVWLAVFIPASVMIHRAQALRRQRVQARHLAHERAAASAEPGEPRATEARAASSGHVA